MLTGNYEAIPGEGELGATTPSPFESMADSFKATYISPFRLFPGQTSDARTKIEQTAEDLTEQANAGDQGIFQRGMNELAGFVGGALNPFGLLMGEGAGAVVSKVIPEAGAFIGRYLPVAPAVATTAIASKRLGSILGDEIPGFIAKQTVGQTAQGALKTFAMGTGFSFPQEVANTYDPKNNTFNWWGGAKASFGDGGIALGLMSVPYLGGTIWGKMFGEAVDHTAMPEEKSIPPEEMTNPDTTHPVVQAINQAQASGRISDDEANWYKDYLSGNDTNENLTNRAVSLLIKDGHPVDSATKQVLLRLFKPEDIDTLQSALADQLANTVPENMKSLFPDFVLNSKIDDIRGNTKMLNGLQGVVEFMNRKLQEAPEGIVKAMKVVRRFLPESIKEENPLTQNKIYRAAKKGVGMGESMPRQVERRLKQEAKIKELKNKQANYQRAFEKSGKTKFQNLAAKAQDDIDRMTANLEPLLSPVDEVKFLRDKLLPEGSPAENFKTSRDYERLHDLTRVRKDARVLMHELHIKDEYAKQDNIRTVLQTITNAMRSTVGNLADKDTILDFMKERVQSKADVTPDEEFTKIKAVPIIDRVADDQTETPMKDEIIKSLEDNMKDADKSVKEPFDQIKNQFKEFNEKQSVLKTLMNCVIGAWNGQF